MASHARRRLIKRQKAGLPPGTLVHVGERKHDQVKITAFDYSEGHMDERDLPVATCGQFVHAKNPTWINIDGLHDTKSIEVLGQDYGLHPLLLEDIVNTEQRPKLEDNDTSLFLVVKMLRFDDASKTVQAEQVSFVIGENFLLTFQEDDRWDAFETIRNHLRQGKGRIRKEQTDYLAYALLDAIVDHYFVVLEKIGEELETLEERLLNDPDDKAAQHIHRLKREMIFVRKAVWPLREVMAALARSESPLIRKGTRLYLRDLYDHMVQVIDTVEIYRDMLSGLLDLHVSSASNRMNAVMKVLTIIATLFIPLTFIVGVYGMNFRVMPELEWEYGYAAVWGVMVTVAVGMLMFFRRKRWL